MKNLLFIKRFGDDDFNISLFYLDDMLLLGHDRAKIDSLKKKLNKSFGIKDLGLAKQTLGIFIRGGKGAKKL